MSLLRHHDVPWRSFAQYLGFRYFYQTGATKELKQYFYTILTVFNGFDNPFQSPHGAVGNFHGVTDLHAVMNFPQFFAVHLIAQVFNDLVRYAKSVESPPTLNFDITEPKCSR